MQGMGTSKEDVIKLAENYKSRVIAGPEPQCGDKFISSICGYVSLCKQGYYNRKYYGGVVLYIHQSWPLTQVQIVSEYQIVAAQVNIATNKMITVPSIYLPSKTDIIENELKEAIKALPKPIILMGDVDAHHIDRVNRYTDRRGRIVESLASNMNLNVINYGQLTHIS